VLIDLVPLVRKTHPAYRLENMRVSERSVYKQIFPFSSDHS
jgi:hypothetical protein